MRSTWYPPAAQTREKLQTPSGDVHVLCIFIHSAYILHYLSFSALPPPRLASFLGRTEEISGHRQTCIEMNGQKIELKEGGGSGNGAARRFYEMPGLNGNIGKLAA